MKAPRHATRNADLFKQRYTRILDKIIGFTVICVMGGLCGVVLTICLTGF